MNGDKKRKLDLHMRDKRLMDSMKVRKGEVMDAKNVMGRTQDKSCFEVD